MKNIGSGMSGGFIVSGATFGPGLEWVEQNGIFVKYFLSFQAIREPDIPDITMYR